MLKFFEPKMSTICSIEGDGGQPAGGGGDGAAPSPDAIAAAEERLKDFTIKAVNGAVSTHLARALENKFTENNNNLLSQIKDMMAAASAPEPAPAGAGTDTDLDTAIKNATAPLLKQIEEQRALNERNAAQAKAERESRMRQEESTELSSALSAAGVPGPLANAAATILHNAIERDADGNILFVCKEDGPTGPYEERVAVAEGVSRFLRTEDGKHFLPARPATGSGNRGGNAPASQNGQISDHEAVMEAMTHLFG